MAAPTLFNPLLTLPFKQRPLFMGKASPNSPVVVCQSGTGVVYARTTADSNGSYLVRSDADLPPGRNSITAYGDLSQGYAPNVDFYIGEAPATKPIETLPPDVLPLPPRRRQLTARRFPARHYQPLQQQQCPDPTTNVHRQVSSICQDCRVQRQPQRLLR